MTDSSLVLQRAGAAAKVLLTGRSLRGGQREAEVKILVTGVAGFIGSHLAETLSGMGHDVVGLDCFTDYYSAALKELNARHVVSRGIPLHRLDLAQDDLAEALDGVEVVYHCAAQPGISDTTPFEAYVRNNIVATRRLAEAAMGQPGLRCFVNASTSSVYGKHATESEEAAPKPTSYYGVTKLAAEQLVLAYQRDRGFPGCSLRIFSVYGPRDRPEKLYPRLIRCILEGAEFPLYGGSLEHSRTFTYVADAVRGFVSVLDHVDEAIGEIFNIGSDSEATTGQGIEAVERIMGAKVRFRTLPPRAGDQLRTRADIAKARRVLGYEPAASLEDGLRAEVEWYRDEVFGRVEP